MAEKHHICRWGVHWSKREARPGRSRASNLCLPPLLGADGGSVVTGTGGGRRPPVGADDLRTAFRDLVRVEPRAITADGSQWWAAELEDELSAELAFRRLETAGLDAVLAVRLVAVRHG